MAMILNGLRFLAASERIKNDRKLVDYRRPNIVALHLMRGLALLCSSSAKTSQAPCQARGDGAF